MAGDYQLRSQADLDAIYPAPSEQVTKTCLTFLHDHHITYLNRAPIVCIGSGDEEGFDVSPRGGEPGFVHIIDRKTIALPDWPGNNKIETLRNLVRDGRIGLLFLFPGLDFFLRINGRAIITRDPQILTALTWQDKLPVTAIVVTVDKAYYHCGRAVSRARLWDSARHIDRKTLPSPGTIMKDLMEFTEMTVEEFDAFYDRGMIENLY
jgi:hypothetical protein